MVTRGQVILMARTGMGNAALRSLKDGGLDVVAVITEQVAGDGFPHYPCEELSVFCDELGVAEWAGVRPRDPEGLSRIRQAGADLFVIASSRNMVPDELVAHFGGRVINCHPSLLPRHRGPTPVPWIIESGERETAMTYMRPTSVLDGGPIWRQVKCDVGTELTAGALRRRMEQEVLTETLADVAVDVIEGRIEPHEQVGEASYEPRFTDVCGSPDFGTTAVESAIRRIRALTPWPGCRVSCNDKQWLIDQPQSIDDSGAAVPGRVTQMKDARLRIELADGSISVRASELTK